MALKETTKGSSMIDSLFEAGAHFGLLRSRRHPSAKPFIFGSKNKVEIFDLEKTQVELEKAKDFIKAKVSEGGLILMVGGKSEARKAILEGAEKVSMPYVAGRWLGGTLTNFPEIKKRIVKLEELTAQKEKGELAKYTKKERLLIDREIESLQKDFSGLASMKSAPKVLFVIDPKREAIAVAEAHRLHIPVVALASSDCNLREVEYAIPGNDASVKSIHYFVSEIVKVIEEGKRAISAPAVTE